MTRVEHSENTSPQAAEFANEGVESLKIERNSRSVNWSFRLVKGPGDDWLGLIDKARKIDGQLAREFGRDA